MKSTTSFSTNDIKSISTKDNIINSTDNKTMFPITQTENYSTINP